MRSLRRKELAARQWAQMRRTTPSTRRGRQIEYSKEAYTAPDIDTDTTMQQLPNLNDATRQLARKALERTIMLASTHREITPQRLAGVVMERLGLNDIAAPLSGLPDENLTTVPIESTV